MPPAATRRRFAGYGAVGRAYGMAFQIRDDVAGIWSSVDETGKTVASDIARRKWTFPVVWAIAQPPSAARDRCRGRLCTRRVARRRDRRTHRRRARFSRRAPSRYRGGRGASGGAGNAIQIGSFASFSPVRSALPPPADPKGRSVNVNGTARAEHGRARWPGRCRRSCLWGSSCGCSSLTTKALRPTSARIPPGRSA